MATILITGRCRLYRNLNPSHFQKGQLFSAIQGERTASRKSFPIDGTRCYVFTARGMYVCAAEDSNAKLNICVSSDKGESFIIKNMIPGEFEYQQDLQKPLASCANLRSMIDTIPDYELFVYNFLASDLLQLRPKLKSLSEETRKSILKSALTGLAELHNRNIIHAGESYFDHMISTNSSKF